jgi:transketolase
MRLGRDLEATVCDFDYDFQIGKAVLMRGGTDITLIACGSVVAITLQAADELARAGISARVINMHTIKPIDREAIVAAASETAGIVTVEEHNVLGGLGSAVCEVVCAERPTTVQRVGIPDVYAGNGPTEDLRRKLDLTPSRVVSVAARILGRAQLV